MMGTRMMGTRAKNGPRPGIGACLGGPRPTSRDCRGGPRPGIGACRGGQATLEYAVFVAVVAAAVGAMAVYVRRSIQANLKQVEDRLNAEAAP